MNKLSVIRMCISNDLKAIEELTAHLAKLRVMEQVALLEQEVDDSLEAYPL